MRFIKYLFGLALTGSLLLSSCGDPNQTKDQTNEYRTYIMPTNHYYKIGDWHTFVINYLLTNNPPGTYSSTIRPAIDSLVYISQRAIFTVSYDTAFIHADTTKLINDLVVLENYSGTGYQYLKNYWIASKSDTGLSNNVPSNELSFVDTIFTFFEQSYPSNLTKVQVCDSAISRITQLISTFNNIAWGSWHGSLAGGTLYVAKSSALIARNHFITNPLDNTYPPVIWKLDAAGYIWGWVEAVIQDANSPGGVRSEGQWRRIKAGGDKANACSGGWLLKQLFGG